MTTSDAIDAWNAAIDAAQDELVRQDTFTMRTLDILDSIRRKEDEA